MLLILAILAQAADAVSYAYGVTHLPGVVELSPLHALGPGTALLAKTGLMIAIVLTREVRGWTAVGIAAALVGFVGLAANVLTLATT